MKKDFTELIGILDGSGSMAGSRIEDTRGGFNQLLDDQAKLPGDCNVTIVVFDHEYMPVVENKPIAEAPRLNSTNYTARGSTALLDAIGRTINTVGNRIANTPEAEQPEHVLVVIATDGAENSSVEFTKEDIKKLKEKYETEQKWKFIFLGADMTSMHDAQKIGFIKTLHYDVGNSRGIQNAYAATSSVLSSYRTGKDDVDIQNTYDSTMKQA